MPANRPPKVAWRKLRICTPALASKWANRSARARTATSVFAPKGPPQESPSEELRRFRDGEISEAEYLSACIERATLHLRGRVSRRKLSRICEVVRELCATDPVLAAMKERVLRPRK